MLLGFKVENFRSIHQEVEFSFESSPIKEHPVNVFSGGPKNTLATSVIYGPNASGKSNVLRAIAALRHLVTNSADHAPKERIGPYEPFLLNAEAKKAPVKFQIDFFQEGLWYTYTVAFTAKEIVEEELAFRPKRQVAILFSRKSGEGISYGEYYKGEKKSVEKKTLPNQLFLSKAVRDNVAVLLPVYTFFEEKLLTLLWIDGVQEDRMQQLYAERLADPQDNAFKKKFNQVLCALDTGISKVVAKKTDWEARPLPDAIPDDVAQAIKSQYEYEIEAIHPVYEGDQVVDEVAFDIDLESKGTRSLLPLLGLILDVLEDGSTLVVDEFEKHLHAHLTKVLIKLFHDPKINRKNAQLLFATHDITQLDSDIFRRDQIWFVEKNERGETELFSLSEVEGVRPNVPFDKWYDSGRFGATPVIDWLNLSF